MTEEYLRKIMKSDFEQCNIADLVNLKCEERNHYKYCLIFQRYWLLCSSCWTIQNAKLYEELKCGETKDFFFYI